MVDPTEITNLRRMAIELNNLGVKYHRNEKLGEAGNLYTGAIKAMILADYTFNNRTEQETNDYLSTWQNELAIVGHTVHMNGLAESNPVSKRQRHQANFMEVAPLEVGINNMNSDSSSILILHNMALLHCHKGELGAALSLLGMTSALIPSELNFGYDCNIACISVIYNVGKIYWHLDREDEAFEMLTDALRLGQKLLGVHSLVASTLYWIGQILVAKGSVQDALDVFQASARIHDERAVEVTKSTFQEKILADVCAPAA